MYTWSVMNIYSFLIIMSLLIFQANIPADRLLIALEPEVAYIYCKTVHDTVSADGFSAFKPGSQYLILDAEGF